MKGLEQIRRDELRIQVMTANPIEASEGDAWYDKAEDVFKRVVQGGVIIYRLNESLEIRAKTHCADCNCSHDQDRAEGLGWNDPP